MICLLTYLKMQNRRARNVVSILKNQLLMSQFCVRKICVKLFLWVEEVLYSVIIVKLTHVIMHIT